MKIHFSVEQGSPEWLALRLGKPTASNMAIILMDGKKQDTRTKYLYKLAAERISGTVEDTYKNAAMQIGNELEPVARDAYVEKTGAEVQQVSFIDCGYWGASPDGLIGDNGGIEIKCRIGSVQVDTLVTSEVPTENLPQIHANLLASDRAWWDYVSYSKGLPLFVQRIERNAEWDARISDALEKFNAELDALVTKLQAIR